MQSRSIHRTLFRVGFPVCGWLSLALFVFAVSGVPIPIPYAKDLSRPFPCMFSQCGCRDADQCWRSCCCHTAAERLVWANAHQVIAPDFLAAVAKTESETAQCEPTAGGCRLPSAPARCCETSARKHTDESVSPGTPADGSLSLIAALKCRGANNVVAGVTICMPPPQVQWRPIPIPQGRAEVALPRITSRGEAPPVPPPRTVGPSVS
jgi:hypothetical protein